jgi:hypothetical protein
MEHPFYNKGIFGEVLVDALKLSIGSNPHRVIAAEEFLWYWNRSNYHALYKEQDMRMADLLWQMSKWHEANIILKVNRAYSESVGKPMLATVVEHQSKAIEDSVRIANECLVKVYPDIHHFKNKGQGEWVNGMPKTVFEPR